MLLRQENRLVLMQSACSYKILKHALIILYISWFNVKAHKKHSQCLLLSVSQELMKWCMEISTK